MAKKKRRKPRKVKKVAPEEGICHIKATFNNTIVTITDTQGNALVWSSGGRIGFTGSKKSTAYAAQLASRECAEKVHDMGMRKVEVWTKGPGSGKEAALRALNSTGLRVKRVKDITPVAFGGCRRKKRRRV